MHKAWCCLGEVPYCFSRSSVKFQDHVAKKIVNFDPDWVFLDCNSILNTPMATKWYTQLEVALKRHPHVFQDHLSNFKVTRDKKPINFDLNLAWSSIKCQCHMAQKIADFDPNWAFPDCNLSLNSLMDLKWCTKLHVVWKRCPIIIRGHPSNFKVALAENSTIWIQFE